MSKTRPELRDLPYWPRCMRRETAAAYLDLSVSQFAKQVKDGMWPAAKRFGGSVRWDRHEIDRWLDSREEGLLHCSDSSDMGAAWEEDAPTRRERWAGRL